MRCGSLVPLASMLIGCARSGGPSDESIARTAQVSDAERSPSFAEEFDGETVDSARWLLRYDPGNPGDPLEGMRANIRVVDGVAHFRIAADVTTPRVSSIQTEHLTLPVLDEDRLVSFTQKYGRFEIRCRMADGSGIHSAFWLLHKPTKESLSSDAPTEIDIFESLGIENARETIHFNVHPPGDAHNAYKLRFDPSLAFHTYALEWTESRLAWFVDGTLAYVYVGPTPVVPMLLLLGVYQGTSSWKGAVAAGRTEAPDFAVDYVRVYSFE